MLLSVHFSVILSLLMYTFLITVLSGWNVLLFLLILCYCCCAHDNDVSHTFTGSRALQLVSELQVPTLADWEYRVQEAYLCLGTLLSFYRLREESVVYE